MAITDIITLFQTITEISFKDLMSIIITIIFAIVIIRIIIYREINEINKDLKRLENKIKWESERLNEKLKIYERLSKIEEKIGI